MIVELSRKPIKKLIHAQTRYSSSIYIKGIDIEPIIKVIMAMIFIFFLLRAHQ